MAKKGKKEEKVEEIHIEEEETAVPSDSHSLEEEFVVAANEMVDFIRELIHEVGIRRIVVKNERHNINFQIPLVFGVVGALALPAAITMVSVVAALVTECSIIVERHEPLLEETAEPA